MRVEFNIVATWGTLLLFPQNEEEEVLLKTIGGAGYRLHEKIGESMKVWLRSPTETDHANWKILGKLKQRDARTRGRKHDRALSHQKRV